MKNILVAVDFDGNASKLSDFAAMFAEKFDAQLWIVHIAAPEPDFVGYETGPQYIRDVRAEDLRKEHRLLQQITDDLKGKSIRAEGLLIQGSTVEAILNEAKKLKVDLIIIGSQKHSLLYNLFAENTSEEVFRKTEIPLLIKPLD